MNLKKYLKKAQKERWAIPQFNFSTMEQLKGIFEAVRGAKNPVILGTSEGESLFFGPEEAVSLARAYNKKYGVQAFLNLDHGKSFDCLKNAIDLGYDAVHFDGSLLPLEKNIEETKKTVKYGRRRGVLVEGELGHIAGESAFHEGTTAIEEKNLTDPVKVAEFVKKTKVDSLAVSIGNVHGIYRTKPSLDFKRLEEIRKITNVFLVLHGGSIISDEEIKKAVSLGIAKINFNSELRLAWKQSLLEALQENPDEIRPYKILGGAQKALQKKVEEKISLLNCRNKL